MSLILQENMKIKGIGNVLFTWNDTGEYKDIRQIWKGTNPSSGEKLFVKEGMPKGYDIPDFDGTS